MIIGISGKMQVGKSTTAAVLSDICGGRRMSFADALRDEVSEKFNISMELLKDSKAKNTVEVPVGNKFMLIRELLQWWGEEKRSVDKNYWVDRLLGDIHDDQLVIIDDVRYKNEAWAIRDRGGILVRIGPYIGYQLNPGAHHLSETDLDNFGATGAWDYIAYPPYGGLGELARNLKARFNL